MDIVMDTITIIMIIITVVTLIMVMVTVIIITIMDITTMVITITIITTTIITILISRIMEEVHTMDQEEMVLQVHLPMVEIKDLDIQGQVEEIKGQV